MFHALLLSLLSLVCLVFCIVVGRAGSGRCDSPFLLRDNWPGYALASLGLAAAAWYRFQAFAWQYELAHDEPLVPKLRRALDLDFHQPVPWAYGAPVKITAPIILVTVAYKITAGVIGIFA